MLFTLEKYHQIPYNRNPVNEWNIWIQTCCLLCARWDHGVQERQPAFLRLTSHTICYLHRLTVILFDSTVYPMSHPGWCSSGGAVHFIYTGEKKHLLDSPLRTLHWELSIENSPLTSAIVSCLCSFKHTDQNLHQDHKLAAATAACDCRAANQSQST